MQAVLKLRRDSENNFNRSNIVLQQGEVAIVSTPFHGTQIKIGDGTHRFNELKYDTFGLLARGFIGGTDASFNDATNHPIDHDEHILFLDQNTGFLYYWNGTKYVHIGGQDVVIATDQVSGISKLYDSVSGQNTDGSVTQRAVNQAFSAVQSAANNINWIMDNETLVTSFSDLQNLNIT